MIEVSADLEPLSRAAARLFADESRTALARHGRFSVALAGGSTPRRAYELLALPPECEWVDWSRIDFFWGDERCVPPSDPRSNERMAREALLDRVPVEASRVHPMRCEGDPAAAALRYESLLRRHFGQSPRFDLLLLGLGADGHIASLFPDSDALLERAHWVAPARGRDVERLTLTLPALNAARRIAFLVSGAAKAQALRAAIAREPIPAAAIAPADGDILWMVDRSAAALLSLSAAAPPGARRPPANPPSR